MCVNAFVSQQFLGETIERLDLIAMAIIITGCITTVMFGAQGDAEPTIDELMARFTALPVIFYFGCVISIFILINLVVTAQETAWGLEMEEYDAQWDAHHDGLETPDTPSSLRIEGNRASSESSSSIDAQGSGNGGDSSLSGSWFGIGAGRGGMNLTAMIQV